MDVVIGKLIISAAILTLIFTVHQLGKKKTYAREDYDKKRNAA